MGVHPSGDGAAWDSIEAIDVDQPQGLDYRSQKHMAVGVRKRIMQEHSEFGDTTAGGIHKPGGCAVLGMEITDTAGDPTALVVADGTYRGHGLIWSYKTDSTDEGVLFCATAAAGASTTGDWTVMALHPDRQWKGGEVTWAGAHEFDASVDISGNVAIDGDLTVDGALLVDGTANCEDDVAFGADVSIDVSFSVGGNANVVGDVSIDGTLAMQDAVLTGDSTFTFDAIAGETGPTFKVFGDWSTKAIDTTYTARTDGCAVGFITQTAARTIHAETPAGTARVYNYAPANTRCGVTIFVKNGNTWCIRGDTTTYSASGVYWLPLGDNT